MFGREALHTNTLEKGNLHPKNLKKESFTPKFWKRKASPQFLGKGKLHPKFPGKVILNPSPQVFGKRKPSSQVFGKGSVWALGAACLLQFDVNQTSPRARHSILDFYFVFYGYISILGERQPLWGCRENKKAETTYYSSSTGQLLIRNTGKLL